MFEYTYATRYGDFKDFCSVKPSSLLDIIQDVAIRHSQSLGYGLFAMRDINMAWMLRWVKVHFDRPAEILKPICARTAVRNMKGVTSERVTFLEQDGKVFAQAIASWFLFDGNKGRAVKIPDKMASSYELQQFDGEFFNFVKPELHDAAPLYTIKVSNRDIDTNIHLNNQKSAELLMNALPFDFAFTDMTVLYKKPAFLGDELTVCSLELDNGFFVCLKNTDGEIAVAGTFEIK